MFIKGRRSKHISGQIWLYSWPVVIAGGRICWTYFIWFDAVYFMLQWEVRTHLLYRVAVQVMLTSSRALHYQYCATNKFSVSLFNWLVCIGPHENIEFFFMVVMGCKYMGNGLWHTALIVGVTTLNHLLAMRCGPLPLMIWGLRWG